MILQERTLPTSTQVTGLVNNMRLLYGKVKPQRNYFQTVCIELVQPITHPSSDAVQVDIQSKIEISWDFYWSLWGNRAVAAANVIGFGSGEERKETIERGNENCGNSKMM